MKLPDKIYLVYENSDQTEGRGPMRLVPNSGFFFDENEAWDFADTRGGVMGRTPNSGSWRNEKYPDVQVKCIDRHDSDKTNRINELESKINQMQFELQQLKQS